MGSSSSWQETAKRTQEYRDKTVAAVNPPEVPIEQLSLNVSKIPQDVLDPKDVELTETTPETLLKQLASGDITSVDLTKAFLRRAALAQKLVSYLLVPC